MARIVVVGAGAVGSYYGALLARAGHEVWFVLRRDYEAVRQNGLDIRSPLGDFRLPRVNVARSAGEAGPGDLVICSLKTTALEEARALVAAAVGPQTEVLALMNGLGIEERFAAWFGGSRLFGGMAFVCINRGEPGVVHHLDYGRVSLGHYEDDPGRLARLSGLLAAAGIEVSVAPSLLAARWEKLCWNIPFNGLSVAAGGVGTRAILDDPALRALAERAMRETVRLGNAELERAGSPARLDEEATVAQLFSLTQAMGDYHTSMVIDYVLGRPIEADAILAEPARRAAARGPASPTIAALAALVRFADRQRRGQAPRLTADQVGTG